MAKRQRRLGGVDDLVISLVAKGLTTGEVQAHLAEIYGVEVSRETISKITDRVLDGLAEWQSRPLDPVYAVIFIDVINVKIRDGQVANRPIYVALAVTADGERDVLGLWAGEHGDGEGAKYWLRVLAEIKNRGAADVLMVVCDGLKGLPDAIAQVWPQAITQTASCTCCATASATPASRTGAGSPGPQAGLHRRVRGRRPGRVRRVQRHLGKAVPGDHPAVGERLGRVRARSWPSTARSGPSSARPTRSSPSTRGSAARSKPAATSPPSRPPSSTSTSPSSASTPPAEDGNAGATGGKPP